MTQESLRAYRALYGKRPDPALVDTVQKYQAMTAQQLRDEAQRRGLTPPSAVHKHKLVIFLVKDDIKRRKQHH